MNKFIWLFIIVLLSACGTSNTVLSDDFQLTHGGTYNLDMPTTAYSYDGEARDISKFYKPENNQYYLGGRYVNKDNIITFTYDNGYDSSKLDINKSLKLGWYQVKQLKDNVFVTYGASKTFGGEMRHTSCKDDYGRQYYCGNATAWSTFDQPENEDKWDAMIKFQITF